MMTLEEQLRKTQMENERLLANMSPKNRSLGGGPPLRSLAAPVAPMAEEATTRTALQQQAITKARNAEYGGMAGVQGLDINNNALGAAAKVLTAWGLAKKGKKANEAAAEELGVAADAENAILAKALAKKEADRIAEITRKQGNSDRTFNTAEAQRLVTNKLAQDKWQYEQDNPSDLRTSDQKNYEALSGEILEPGVASQGFADYMADKKATGSGAGKLDMIYNPDGTSEIVQVSPTGEVVAVSGENAGETVDLSDKSFDRPREKKTIPAAIRKQALEAQTLKKDLSDFRDSVMAYRDPLKTPDDDSDDRVYRDDSFGAWKETVPALAKTILPTGVVDSMNPRDEDILALRDRGKLLSSAIIHDKYGSAFSGGEQGRADEWDFSAAGIGDKRMMGRLDAMIAEAQNKLDASLADYGGEVRLQDDDEDDEDDLVRRNM